MIFRCILPLSLFFTGVDLFFKTTTSQRNISQPSHSQQSLVRLVVRLVLSFKFNVCGGNAMDNENPVVYEIHQAKRSLKEETFDFEDEEEEEPMRPDEVFDYIRHLNDPEHPLTLEQLNVLSVDHIEVDNETSSVRVMFTPTIPHCSMATLIGLSIRVKLLRSLSRRYKVSVEITPGTHQSEDAVNKQLNDKERVAAALENSHLLSVVNKCICNTDLD